MGRADGDATRRPGRGKRGRHLLLPRRLRARRAPRDRLDGLRPARLGQVVNPEAKLLLLSHAFDVLGAGRVQLKTDVRNHRSQQAIARLGARYEATLRRYQRREDGTVHDTVLFSILAEEWPAVRDGLLERISE